MIAKQVYNLGFKQKRKIVDTIPKKNRLCGNFKNTAFMRVSGVSQTPKVAINCKEAETWKEN